MDQNAVPPPPTSTMPLARRLKIALGTTAAVAVAGALLAAGTIALHARAGDGDAVAVRPPTPVRTLTVERQETVTRSEIYVGRLEAARSIHLAFERSGTVEAVMVEEGDRVEEGMVVALLDTDLLTARRAELLAEREALDADVELARLTTDRQQELQRLGHASTQRYDEARLSYTRLKAARLRVDAAIRALDVDLDKSVLTAPFAGEVTARMLDEGAVVAPGAAVLDLIERDRPQVRVGLPEAVAASLSQGQPITIETALGPVGATVNAVRADIDPRTRTQIVLLDLPATDAAFGSAVEVMVERTVAASGFWVPVTALREGRRGLWTLMTVVPGEDGPVAGTESVEILFLQGERAYVRGSLADGAEIVADGNHRVVPGSPLGRAGPGRTRGS
jgi:RND family efflux transporter MFP subunit